MASTGPSTYLVVAPDARGDGRVEVSFYEDLGSALRDAKLAEGRLFSIVEIADFEKDGD